VLSVRGRFAESAPPWSDRRISIFCLVRSSNLTETHSPWQRHAHHLVEGVAACSNKRKKVKEAKQRKKKKLGTLWAEGQDGGDEWINF
jgi:hypothetical protein